MTGYVIRRVLQALLITIGVTLIVFILGHLLLPGGVARAILGPKATAPQIAAFNIANGLNQSLPVQYFDYLKELITGQCAQSTAGGQSCGHFGYSYHNGEDVGGLLESYLPKTLVLMGMAYAVAIIVAVPLGIYQAVRRNHVDDYVFTGASFVLYAMPVFWLGLILIVVFGVTLNWLPTEGPQGSSVLQFGDQLNAFILPVATLSLVTIALFSRYMRSSVIENMVQDYVRTARAKGASGTRVLYVHVLRNAMIPIVTLIGLTIGYIFAGALITESVFNYPGMGLFFWTSALYKDYPSMEAVIVVTGLATVLGNLVADLLYAVADPRVRYARR
jgi:peptide/nickel transport system permease protein